MAIFYAPPRGGGSAAATPVSMGQLLWPPDSLVTRSIVNNVDALNLTAKKTAYIGNIRWEDGESHVVSAAGGGKVVAVTGACTFANAGTTIRVGIQDISTAAGNGPQPDGTFDVSKDFVGATDTITGSAVNNFTMTGGSGSKTIAHGAPIAIVFDCISRAGADSVIISVKDSETFATNQSPWPTYNAFDAAAWTKTANVTYYQPNCYLVADDGAVGIFENSPVITGSAGNAGWTSATNPNERGILVTVPKTVLCVGVWAYAGVASSSGGNEFKIYSSPTTSPTLVTSVTPSSFWYGRDNVAGMQRWKIDEFELTAADYAITQLATGAAVNSLQHGIACVAESLQAFPGNPRRVTRNGSAGAFTVDASATITLPTMGLIIESF